ncbi:MOSC domain-containing protein [Brevibacterium sp. R8603A2]|uniref:MOSC domain-containing protein n=1 Tax=Brevibacterium sp. R8603A2 TaxID=2929779 RepID=UPI001FF83E61|nr:MOSC domain-containing protein [Brevibacterium sp. R8603A2]
MPPLTGDPQPAGAPQPAGSPQLTGTVERVCTGSVTVQHWSGREISTGARKTPHAGPVELGALGLRGDAQGNTKVHGGPDKAVCCYPAEHYPRWAADGIAIGEDGFFENLTVSGLPEDAVHLGDVFALGTARVQVTQPRRPCTTVSARWGDRELPRLMQSTGRCGYYLRVLEPGAVGPGDAMVLEERLPDSMSVAEVNRVMNVDRTDREGIEGLLASPELPEKWRTQLTRRLHTGTAEDDATRLGD